MAAHVTSVPNRALTSVLSPLGAIAMLLSALAVPAFADDGTDFASARASGAVGEKIDGYVAVVGAGSPALRKLVEDINIRRKAVYAEKAAAQHATVEEYALSSGCQLIARTQPGWKYQGPSGEWLTRGAGAPERDSRCP